MANVLKTRTRQQERPPDGEVFANVANALFRHTAGLDQPLRVRRENLDLREQRELVDLAVECDGPTGLRLTDLPSRKLKRFERLAAKGAGMSEDHFDQLREQEKHRAEFADIGRQIRMPPRRIKLAEPGSIELPKQWCWDFVRDRVLWPSHLGLLCYLLATFENGGPPIPAPGISFDDGTLIVDVQRAAIPPDPGGSYVAWKDLLRHLAANGLVELTEEGRIWKIRPGSRVRNATTRAA